MDAVARLLILVGLVTVALGVILLAAARVPFLGRLPGDIHIKTDGVSIYFPVVTTIILSIVLTLVLNVVVRLIR